MHEIYLGFWKNFEKPIMVLAPMADVTDIAFRSIIAKYSKHQQPNGGPDVFWTEFVSADGLCHPAGREALLQDLKFTESERPIVAQLFSSNPGTMRRASKLCAELGFEGIDINMGCPDRTIEKQGAGACMIKTPDVAAAIIQAAKEGIQDAGKEIPVSVKTRLGYNKNEMETWIPFLLQQNIAVLTVHLRTRKEMSDVPARWDLMADIVKMRNHYAPETLIFGNGDVANLSDAYKKVQEMGCDGIMIGRAIFGNPWLFAKSTHSFCALPGGAQNWMSKFFSSFLRKIGIKKKDKYWLETTSVISVQEKLRVMVEHAQLFETMMPQKNFAIMKKHFKAYAHGFPCAKELRVELMATKNAEEVGNSVEKFLQNQNIDK